jgi:hypothetical protein
MCSSGPALHHTLSSSSIATSAGAHPRTHRAYTDQTTRGASSASAVQCRISHAPRISSLALTSVGRHRGRSSGHHANTHTHTGSLPPRPIHTAASAMATSAVQTDGRHTAIVRRAMHTGLAYHMVCHRPPAPSGQAPANGWLVPHSTDEAAITPTPSSSNPPHMATARPATSGHRGGGIA